MVKSNQGKNHFTLYKQFLGILLRKISNNTIKINFFGNARLNV